MGFGDFAIYAYNSAKREERKAIVLPDMKEDLIGELKTAEFEKVPLYDFRIIETATNDFSFANKVGEGGFGSVYKVL